LRGRPALILVLALPLLAAACARRGPLPPSPEGFLYPSPTAGEAREAEVLEKAWRRLLLGDTRKAERSYRGILNDHPGHLAAQTGLGYALMKEGRLEAAGQAFSEALERHPEYVPALAGAATAAQRQGRPEQALAFSRRAQALAPANPALRRLVAEVRLQLTERRVAAAAEAAAAGDTERAIETYRAALDDAPEVAGVRLALAGLLWERGDRAGSLAVLEADPGGDRNLALKLGESLLAMGEHERALRAYRRILARDPQDEEAQQRSRNVRQELELLQMPEEYRRIAKSPSLTRADLAALLSVKVTALSRLLPGEPQVAVDISGSWARPHILKVLAFDIMTPYPNHTFQPGTGVRRGELARSLQRLLDLLGYPPSPTPVLTDMSRNHMHYAAAGRVVAAGLMELTPGGAFEPWRPVSGLEASDVIEGLVRLVGP